MPKRITHQQVADHLDLGLRHLGNLFAAGKLPRPAVASLDEIRITYIRGLREAAGRTGSGDKALDLARERARLAKERADAQELKNAIARGEQLPIATVETWLVALLSGVRTRLLALPAKVAPLVHAAKSIAQAEEIIRRHQCEALDEIADAGAAYSEGQGARSKATTAKSVH